MGMSEETKDTIVARFFSGFLIVAAIAAVSSIVVLFVVIVPANRAAMEEEEATKYEKEPVIQCVDGIKYVSLFNDTANVTVKIDPETLKPERCSDGESE